MCRGVRGLPLHLAPAPHWLSWPCYSTPGRRRFSEDGRSPYVQCSCLAVMGWQGASVPRKTWNTRIASCHHSTEGGQPLCAGVHKEMKREVQISQGLAGKAICNLTLPISPGKSHTCLVTLTFLCHSPLWAFTDLCPESLSPIIFTTRLSSNSTSSKMSL